ncbi:MAG TPA: hypothetical protein VI958_08590, partial [Acidobacteriota bacterium]
MAVPGRAILAVILYLLLYALSIFHLSSAPGFHAGESLAVFLIFGVGFTLAAWLSTIGAHAVETPVRAPGREFGATLVYLGIFAFVVLGWGFSALKEAITSEPYQEIVILFVKLLTMVVLPAFLLIFFGYSLREMFGARPLGKAGWRTAITMAMLLFLLQALVGRGLQNLAALEVSDALIYIMA